MKLFLNEVVIPTSLKGVTLTNQRIRYENGPYLSSMFLHEVSSIHYKKDHQPAFLLLGVFLLLVAGFMLANNPTQLMYYIAAGGLLFVSLYLSTRSTDVEIISRGGGKIEISVAKRGDVVALVDLVEEVKTEVEKLANTSKMP